MGITYDTARYLINCYCSNSNSIIPKVNFTNTLTLGRQYYFPSKQKSMDLFQKKFLNNFTNTQLEGFFYELQDITATSQQDYRYAEPFFRLLGASVVDALDYSDYEGANVIHDLTMQISDGLRNRYSCVIDGGLLEHVYKYPAALKNAMDMVAIGGHIILITPGNNWFGHGFYQLSPELFYSVLREENGFFDTKVLCCINHKFYLVKSPRDIHQRTEISPPKPLQLYVISKKVSDIPDVVNAYQSDYEDVWSGGNIEHAKSSRLHYFFETMSFKLPTPVRLFIRKVYQMMYYSKIMNQSHYKRMFSQVFQHVDL